MNTLTRRSLALVALCTGIVAVPTEVSAQECSVQIVPAELEHGLKAVPVTITMSQAVGAVTGVDAPRGSGIVLASPSDLPRTEMASVEGQPRPIKMGEAENVWTVWLNVAEAKAGAHNLSFTGQEGRCAGRLVIREGA
jgi:hypothetical protein